MNSYLQQIERSLNSQRQKYLNDLIFYGGGELRIRQEDGTISEVIHDATLFPEVPIANTNFEISELESRTIQLEDKQFSPTSKLTGETVFSFSDTF